MLNNQSNLDEFDKEINQKQKECEEKAMLGNLSNLNDKETKQKQKEYEEKVKSFSHF